MQGCLIRSPARFHTSILFWAALGAHQTVQSHSRSRAFHAHAAHAHMQMKTDHAQRTASEPRDPSLHKVVLARIDDINPTIRTFRLDAPSAAGGIRFLPGQWLDVFVPGISKPGGFTITSPPSKARIAAAGAAGGSGDDAMDPASSPPPPYLELAVQKSPENVVAQWLWQPADAILSSELHVRVGGSFVWPPPGVMPMTLRRLVFVAGGVGINPLMSILSHLAEQRASATRYIVSVLYCLRDPSHRDPAKMLFVSRLAEIFDTGKLKGGLRLFLTGGEDGKLDGDGDLSFEGRRITIGDVDEAIGGPENKRFAVVYICGLPRMTDEFVEKSTSPTGLGLEKHRVLYEKWW